jgi:hypothetical protein
VVVIVMSIGLPNVTGVESSAMINIECPWCAGTATVEVADGDEFSCTACSIRVEIAPDPLAEPLDRAA